MTGLSLVGAFVGGALTILSPCSVMLLPAFFSYAFTATRTLLARTGTFYLGLITTLVPLGLLAGSLGAFVTEHRSALVSGASWLVIALGVAMVLDLPLLPRASAQAQGGSSTAAVYALGTVYGLAGVCAGPLLGSVLTLAAMGGDPAYGGLVLLVFAAGMVLPLVVLSMLWDRWPVVRGLVRPRAVRLGRWTTTWTNVVGGLATIAIGIVLVRTKGTASLPGVLTTSQQFEVERWAMRRTGSIPDLAFVVVAVAVLGAGWLYRQRRSAAIAAAPAASAAPATPTNPEAP